MPNPRSYSTSRVDSSSIIRLCRRPVLSSQAELLVSGRDLGHAGRLHGGNGTLYRVSPAAAEQQLRSAAAAAAAAGTAGDAADPAQGFVEGGARISDGLPVAHETLGHRPQAGVGCVPSRHEGGRLRHNEET